MVTRKTNKGTVLGPEEKLTPEEAVHCYTWCGAFTQFAEERKGTLEVGMLADIAVLSKDVFSIDPDEILRTQADLTFRDGAAIFDRHGEAAGVVAAQPASLRHAIHRLLLAIPVMFGVVLIDFLLMQVVPTGPASGARRADRDAGCDLAIQGDLGLDQPLYAQFGRYVWRLLHGDLGTSIINNVPVVQELGAIGPTVELMLASLFWSIPIGILLGTLAGYWRGSLFDRAIMALSVAGVSVPVFFIGLMMIWLVGFQWQLLPFTGRAGPIWTWDGMQSLILPALTLGSSSGRLRA